jgi:chromosome segregation ATPase
MTYENMLLDLKLTPELCERNAFIKNKLREFYEEGVAAEVNNARRQLEDLKDRNNQSIKAADKLQEMIYSLQSKLEEAQDAYADLDYNLVQFYFCSFQRQF